MARIVEDYGQQRVMREGAVVYISVFGMDCGCTIEVDLRGYLLRDAPLGDLVTRTAAYHDCDIVVNYAPPSRRREMARRGSILPGEPPIRYLGVPVIPDPRTVFNELWDYMRPNPRPERSRGQPAAPREAPEQVVRNAIAAPAEFNHQNPLGFQPDKKKQEDPPRPDRFDLIELD